MVFQGQHIEQAIAEDKWYLSEKAGHDVGMAAARRDFDEKHLPRVSVDWRVEFCGRRCSHRAACLLGKKMIARDGRKVGA